MSSPGLERMVAGITDFYDDLQRTVGQFGLQLAGESLGDCIKYSLIAGQRVHGRHADKDSWLMLGSPAIVPQETMQWSGTLGVQINLHRPVGTE